MKKDENLIINIDEYPNVILKSETYGNYQVRRVNHFDGWAPYLELYNLDDKEVKIYENATKKFI